MQALLAAMGVSLLGLFPFTSSSTPPPPDMEAATYDVVPPSRRLKLRRFICNYGGLIFVFAMIAYAVFDMVT